MKRHLRILLAVIFASVATTGFSLTYNVTTNVFTGAGSITEAVTAANAAAGPHTININLAAGSVITFTNVLNINQQDITIVGPLNGAAPGVIFAGATTFDGLDVFNGYATNARLTIRNVIFQSFRNAVLFRDGTDLNVIENCWFGINAAGTSSAGVTIGEAAIKIQGSTNNVIGSTTDFTAATRVVVAGSSKVGGNYGGIYIQWDNSDNNTISNVYVGTNVAGTSAASTFNGNTEVQNQAGIMVEDADNTLINRCVVSGNIGCGIKARGGANNLTVYGCHIGVDAAGTAAMGNYAVGIYIDGGSGHIIGGTGANQRNVVSANGQGTLFAQGNGATQFEHFNLCGIYGINISNSTIAANYVGTDVTGNVTSTALGNDHIGIKLVSSNNCTIGGTTDAAGNVVCGNGFRSATPATGWAGFDGHGIVLQGTTTQAINVYNNYVGLGANGTTVMGNNQDGINMQEGVHDNNIGAAGGLGNTIVGNTVGIQLMYNSNANLIRGNVIGLNATGTVAMGNSDCGILIGGNAYNNTVGGTTAGEGNLICANTTAGIGIMNTYNGTGNSSGNTNYVYGNVIGLNVAGTAVPNGIGVLIQDGGFNNVIGSATGAGANVISGNTGNGVQIVGGTGVNTRGNQVVANFIGIDALGASKPNGSNGIFVDRVPGVSGQQTLISLNTISSNGNNGISIASSQYTTMTANKIGTNIAGTAAMANGDNGVSITGATSANNTVGSTTAGQGNVISGNTEHGVFISTSGSAFLYGNTIGLGSDGSTALGNALNGVYVSGSTGVVIGAAGNGRNIISSNGGATTNSGIFFTTSPVTITNNYIGLDLAGTANRGNSNHGIDGASTTAASITNNYISFNGAGTTTGSGINLTTCSTTVISGNFIGVTTANGAAGNNEHGVALNSSVNTTLGNATAGNVISANASNGVLINTSIGTLVQYNRIGTDNAGTATTLGNALNGILITGTSTGNIIGVQNPGAAGGSVAAQNYIAYNTEDGISLTSAGSTNNPISRNRIYCNGQRGIELNGVGNGNYAAPVIAPGASTTAFSGTAPANAYVEIFSNNTCTSCPANPTRLQGLTYVGTTQADASGNWSYTSGTPISEPVATASSANSGSYRTSEFSACRLACTDALPPTAANVNRNDICFSTGGTIDLTVTGGSGTEVAWYANGGPGVGTFIGTGTGTNGLLNTPIPNDTTTYYAVWRPIPGSGCDTSSAVSVEVIIIPDPTAPASVDASDAVVCPGDPDITLTAIGGNGLQLVWYAGGCGTGTPIGTGISLNLPVPTATTEYFARWETDNCVSTCASVTINVTTPPAMSLDTGICANEVSVTITAPEVTGATYIWSFEGNVVLSGPSNVYVASQTGNYNLNFSDPNGCGAEDFPFTVSARDLPTVDLASVDSTCMSMPLQLTATVTGGQPPVVNGVPQYTYFWFTKDSVFTSTEANPVITPGPDSTVYYLSIFDGGCYATLDSIKIYNNDEGLFFPNVFTPNDDDKNQNYLIRNLQPNSQFIVYNRWGKQVYKNDNYDNSWNGEGASDGTYYYYLKSSCPDQEYKGWVQIVR